MKGLKSTQHSKIAGARWVYQTNAPAVSVTMLEQTIK